MYTRLAFTLLFGFAVVGFGLAIPASPFDSQCGDPNAEYLECGSACPPTCRRPHPPHCSLRCFRGCFCKDGYLRNDEGKCVKTADCDDQPQPRIPMQIPSAASSFPTCPEKEEFLACGSACAPTCAQPESRPFCTKNCVVGCFCLEGHLRNEQGACVPKEQCSAKASVPVIPMQPRVCEDMNEEFRQCRGCDGTCDNPNPICPRICIAGCACKIGHLRDGASGKCIPKETCLKASPQSFMMMPPTKKCGEFEIFRQCGTACPATCHRPHPPRCSLRCIPGCFCQDGYLKNSEGKCVPAAQCEQEKTTPAAVETKCSSDREMFAQECGTQMDCMATCHMALPWIIHGHVQIPQVCKNRQCAPACVCKYPYVRNENGQCVERAECDNTTTASH